MDVKPLIYLLPFREKKNKRFQLLISYPGTGEDARRCGASLRDGGR